MKYGILGDIHGNLSALEVVLAAMSREGIEQLISVGDIVPLLLKISVVVEVCTRNLVPPSVVSVND